MPFYRVNGLMMHVKLSGKGAKTAAKACCARVEFGGGTHRCMGISSYLCDWEVEGGTCDAPLCDDHARQIGKDRHLCPIHAALHQVKEPELW